MGYQINVTVGPAVSGILVQLWWVLGGVPALILDTENTDSNGQVSFNPGASSYPVYMRVIVPPGHMIGGIEYGGAESADLECYEGSVFTVSLTLSPVAHWEHLEFYRGIEIEVYMPDGTPYRAYYDGKWDINYELSSIKAGIDAFLEPEPTGIPTTLTIDAPASVATNEAFLISGILYETGTGVPIPGQRISLSYMGPGFTRDIGNATTGVDGDYLLQASIPDEGTFTLLARFAGTEGFQASRALVDAVVATPLVTVLKIAGPIATAIVLVLYGTS